MAAIIHLEKPRLGKEGAATQKLGIQRQRRTRSPQQATFRKRLVGGNKPDLRHLHYTIHGLLHPPAAVEGVGERATIDILQLPTDRHTMGDPANTNTQRQKLLLLIVSPLIIPGSPPPAITWANSLVNTDFSGLLLKYKELLLCVLWELPFSNILFLN